MNKKVDNIVREAEARSRDLIGEIDESRGAHRANAELVVAVCKELLTARPVQEPSAIRVAEAGAVRYPSFPAKQSLKNRYRDLLRIWRGAYEAIVSVTAPKALKVSDEVFGSTLEHLDSSSKALVQTLRQTLEELRSDNNRLKSIILKEIPAPRREDEMVAAATPALLPLQSSSVLKKWMDGLSSDDGPLKLESAGVRVTRIGLPGRVVIPPEVVEVLKSLC
ncbi:MAG TPA: hypothetical protein VIF40_07520 [Methylosinus sp.]|jgi:hypothetical protein|uniref:hypothetical protein n=1 Tax=Methylosinus sp. TaxID=427 RepID=UPI002F92C5F7